MTRDFHVLDEPRFESNRPQDHGLQPVMLRSFTGNLLIDKQTGDTWLLVPELNAEASHWHKLPRSGE